MQVRKRYFLRCKAEFLIFKIIKYYSLDIISACVYNKIGKYFTAEEHYNDELLTLDAQPRYSCGIDARPQIC